MLKSFAFTLVIGFFITAAFCQSQQIKSSADLNVLSSLITEDQLKAKLYFITSDLFQGRAVGSAGELLCAEYIASQYMSWGIPPAGNRKSNNLSDYLQSFPFQAGQRSGKSQNVIAFIEGSDPQLKNDVIVLSSHYDHVGIGAKVEGDSIYNGAADDGSGTVVMLEIAHAIMEAKMRGLQLKRSILFLHTGGEESGLLGSAYYTMQEPIVSLEKTFATINMDGVGGTDKPDAANANSYVYLLHNDSTSSKLRYLAVRVNERMSEKLDLLVPANPQQFNSDSKSFEYQLVPTLYFSTGLTEHYHKPSDEAHTINYAHMASIARLVFSFTCEVANTTASMNFDRTGYQKTGKYFCKPCGCSLDNKEFDEPGKCTACNMVLQPYWKKL
ncbi:MAG TPA: M28 family peptidase [Chryseosolibacter sp.]|nr:M28 family peptidase [Chryseosolibacter sp.]